MLTVDVTDATPYATLVVTLAANLGGQRPDISNEEIEAICQAEDKTLADLEADVARFNEIGLRHNLNEKAILRAVPRMAIAAEARARMTDGLPPAPRSNEDFMRAIGMPFPPYYQPSR